MLKKNYVFQLNVNCQESISIHEIQQIFANSLIALKVYEKVFPKSRNGTINKCKAIKRMENVHRLLSMASCCLNSFLQFHVSILAFYLESRVKSVGCKFT